MLAANGVGIAAPQLFVSQRVIIIASRSNPRYPDAPDMAPLAMVNPVVEAQSGDWVEAWEGCLSVPGLRGKVRRRNEVSVCYQDASGQAQQRKLSGFPARILLHEVDHLEGLTFLDRVDSPADLINTAAPERPCSHA